MNFNFVNNIQTCFDFINNESPLSLIYYSHFLTVIVALILGIVVLFYSKDRISGWFLFLISSVFTLWVIIDLITWISVNSLYYMFFWSLFGILTSFLYLLCVFFSYSFINKKNISFKIFLPSFLLVLPIILFTPTYFNLSGFSIVDCISLEQPFFTNYFHILGILSFIWIFILAFIGYRKEKDLLFKKQIILVTLGIELFIISFLISTFLDSYLVNLGMTDVYTFGNYGLFGMPIFIAFLTYLIVKFKSFEIKLIGSQALVVGIIILIGSQFFFIQSNTNRVLTAITLFISTVMGILIVRSVKKEIELRERIEILAGNLERANSNLKHINIDLDKANNKLKELDQLKTEFVGLATHQIRGPLTAIKGYLSMMLEGDYGKVSKSIEDIVRIVFSSAESLSVIVSDFLNVSRIEQGQMKYNMEDCDVRALVEEVIKELKPNTDSRGLEMRLDISSEPCIVHIDKEKIKQVVNNLIDNSSKYTKVGSILVSLHKKDDSKVLLAIKDTGVGITKDTLPHLFEKFSRAKDAFKTNILGTGLGLYVAKKIIEAHKGRVWAESEGEGKGSQFYVEFEAVK
ncbi:MAG: ATP-binding protein [Candidatus Paceibacterota bacterium]|jgi:signal transduction histidine kinase